VISDWGYKHRPHGWYDSKDAGRGPVDYGRYVGDDPNIIWSVVVFGSSNEYSDAGEYEAPDPAVLEASQSLHRLKGQLNRKGQGVADGQWTVVWVDGNRETIALTDGRWTLFGASYSLDSGRQSFTWPDGTRQTVDRIGDDGTVHWRTTHKGYCKIQWVR